MTSHTARRTSRNLLALAMALAAIVAVLVVPGPEPAGSAPAPPKLLGPLLSKVENPTTSLGRDGGFSASLPNGFDFWVFADTPRYEFRKGKWRLVSFITGSTASMVKFTPGKPLANPLSEIRPGAQLKGTNQPAQFMSTPTAYMPDGSGKKCMQLQQGRKAFSVRWPVGVALMPDKKNLLIPYAIVCVLNQKDFFAQGWGFARFNYKTQKFTTLPTNVVKPQTNGAEMPAEQMWGSPIVVGNKVSFYSWRCCEDDAAVYTTTIDATVAALKNPASYVPTQLTDIPDTYNLHAAKASKNHTKLSMYVLTGNKGQYSIYSAPASSPTGPWTKTASGVLPRCDTSPIQCHSMALHPELSPPGRLIVSYHLPAYGPGVATKHPYPHEPLRHVVSASIPCSC